jgi:hypothetical protein
MEQQVESQTETLAEGRMELVCPECGELISVSDVAALIRGLHQQNNCPALAAIFAER